MPSNQIYIPSNKLWNTGVDDQGKPLPAGSADPHWMLVQAPGLVNPQNVYVLGAQPVATYFMTSDSNWVWADPSLKIVSNSDYVFQTVFYVELDLSQHWIEIKGKWGADNFGHFTIDGAVLPPGSVSGEISLPVGNVFFNYNQTHGFSISQAHFLSLSQLGLNIGWHTLEIWVRNEGTQIPANPAGLNVSALEFAIHPRPRIPTHFH